MGKPEQIDIEPTDADRDESSLLYLLAVHFREVAVKQEDFDWAREQTWREVTLDKLLALILASNILENRQEVLSGFSIKSLQGLCNTIRFLYDFNNVRFDGENYWFSVDKKIINQLKKRNKK